MLINGVIPFLEGGFSPARGGDEASAEDRRQNGREREAALLERGQSPLPTSLRRSDVSFFIWCAVRWGASTSAKFFNFFAT